MAAWSLATQSRELRLCGRPRARPSPGHRGRGRRTRTGRTADARTTTCRRCRSTRPAAPTARRPPRRGRRRRRRGSRRVARRGAHRDWSCDNLFLGRRAPADTAEADVARPGVHHLRPAGCRSVAQAVGVGAQVRAALDHACARSGTAAAPGRSSAPGHHRAGSPARSTACRRRRGAAGSTSRRSTPRRCRPCRTGRSRWPGKLPTGAVRSEPALPGAPPGEVGSVPGVRHDPARRAVPRRPRCTSPPRGRRGRRTPTRPRSGRSAPAQSAYASGVLVGDVDDRVVRAALHRAARPLAGSTSRRRASRSTTG